VPDQPCGDLEAEVLAVAATAAAEIAPEPSTVLLLGIGLAVLVTSARRAGSGRRAGT